MTDVTPIYLFFSASGLSHTDKYHKWRTTFRNIL